MAKVLPCETCGGPAQLPGGKPYVMGRVPDGIIKHPFRYKCAKCRRTTMLTALDFNRLPEIGLPELRDLGLEDLAMKDLRGAGLDVAHVEQALAAGVTLEQMHPTIEERHATPPPVEPPE